MDPAPYFVGLPADRCQCVHWGVVTDGQITFRWPDHEETYVAGDAYFAPPGHLPLITAGTAIVEFSPTTDLDATMAVVQGNLAAAARHDDPAATDTSVAVAGLISFLETGVLPEGLFAPDVFADLSLSHWRVQTDTAVASSRSGSPATRSAARCRWSGSSRPGTGSRSSSRTVGPRGPAVVCREMIRADVVADAIVEMSIYCTGAGTRPSSTSTAGRAADPSVTGNRPVPRPRPNPR